MGVKIVSLTVVLGCDFAYFSVTNLPVIASRFTLYELFFYYLLVGDSNPQMPVSTTIFKIAEITKFSDSPTFNPRL